MGFLRLLFWLWIAPYVIAYGAGFATAMLIGPIRKRWLALYDAGIDPPHVHIPIVTDLRKKKT